jgi:hypothetical protein
MLNNTHDFNDDSLHTLIADLFMHGCESSVRPQAPEVAGGPAQAAVPHVCQPVRVGQGEGLGHTAYTAGAGLQEGAGRE